ncbi:N-carbamoyl-L-amino-acid hydrolase [Alteromonadaceae bacterium 2753L.S.0a.02]|nr:N-carbamoyl-L-amino-acid hydrolase [Alteromonadaceae bacterium 2753L.S.0a.02]
MTFKINLDRVKNDIYTIGRYGYNAEDQGVYRQGFTDEDIKARAWLQQQFDAEGLVSDMDGAGNVIGRWGSSDNKALIIGSHLDSVPAGGMFDGVLGVVAGFECIRVIKENNIPLKHAVEVIATSEEEGRFGGMLGAQALSGDLKLDWLERAKDAGGEMLRDAMARYHMPYHKAMEAARDPNDLIGFLELHIEQGPVLEQTGNTIGVVEGISGVFKWKVKLIGKADHAGTAPMNLRSDAFMGVADFAHEIARIIDEEGTDKSRLTIGSVELKPGFAHTVPGKAEFTLVGRDMSESVMTAIADSCRKVLSAIARRHKLMFEYEQMSWLAPRHCSPEMMELLQKHSQAMDFKTLVMPSGAGHDAQFFTDITPTGLLFVPSVGGVSHAPDEWTHWHDVEKGCNVLLNAVLELVAK